MKKPEPPPLTIGEKLIFLIPVLAIVLMVAGSYLCIHYNVKIVP